MLAGNMYASIHAICTYMYSVLMQTYVSIHLHVHYCVMLIQFTIGDDTGLFGFYTGYYTCIGFIGFRHKVKQISGIKYRYLI